MKKIVLTILMHQDVSHRPRVKSMFLLLVEKLPLVIPSHLLVMKYHLLVIPSHLQVKHLHLIATEMSRLLVIRSHLLKGRV